MYKYEKQLPENTVAALYATGFAAGGLSAAFVGGLADRFGRKLACLMYCLLYMITCLTMLSNNLSILFVGRVAGGVATTLLFSAFEAWVISDYHERGLRSSKETPLLEPVATDLDSTFTAMTTLSCIVAILSGIIGDALVQRSGTRTWPFIAAMFCSIAAAGAIGRNWVRHFSFQLVFIGR